MIASNQDQLLADMIKAIQNGMPYRMAPCLDQGLDINHQTRHSGTALMNAALEGNAWMITFLLERGADPNIKDPSQRNCVHYACSSEEVHVSSLEELHKGKADLDEVDKDGETPLSLALHHTFENQGSASKVMLFLLRHGANPHRVNRQGKSFLEDFKIYQKKYASQYHQLIGEELDLYMKMLIQHQDLKWQTPLIASSKRQNRL